MQLQAIIARLLRKDTVGKCRSVLCGCTAKRRGNRKYLHAAAVFPKIHKRPEGRCLAVACTVSLSGKVDCIQDKHLSPGQKRSVRNACCLPADCLYMNRDKLFPGCNAKSTKSLCLRQLFRKQCQADFILQRCFPGCGRKFQPVTACFHFYLPFQNSLSAVCCLYACLALIRSFQYYLQWFWEILVGKVCRLVRL